MLTTRTPIHSARTKRGTMALQPPPPASAPVSPLVVAPGVAPTRAPGTWRSLRHWPRRRWLVAFGGALATVLVIGLTTAMIPNPVFGRSVATTWWAWPVLVVTAALSGLLGATYVRGASAPEQASGTGMIGGVLSYLAVGCPVCNKLALLALGYTGALRWFAPVQPWLAAAGVVLLAYALQRRLRSEVACPVPARNPERG